MWEAGAAVLLFILKFVFERINQRKLTDSEFLKHIEAHQKKRQNAAVQAQDFEESMQQAQDELDK